MVAFLNLPGISTSTIFGPLVTILKVILNNFCHYDLSACLAIPELSTQPSSAKTRKP